MKLSRSIVIPFPCTELALLCHRLIIEGMWSSVSSALISNRVKTSLVMTCRSFNPRHHEGSEVPDIEDHIPHTL